MKHQRSQLPLKNTGTQQLQKLKKQIEEENIDNIRKEKEECFSESMLGALSGGVGLEEGWGMGLFNWWMLCQELCAW